MESPRLWCNDIYDFSFVFTPVYNTSVFPKYQIWSIVKLLLNYGENLISRVWKNSKFQWSEVYWKYWNQEEKYRKCTHNLTLIFLPLTTVSLSLYSGIFSACNFIDCGLSGFIIHSTHFIWKTVEFRKKVYWTQNVSFDFHYRFFWIFLNLKTKE
jgi:hypothetical protein